jgi:hypothetical protein
MSSFLDAVRTAVYSLVVDRHARPSAEAVARTLGVSVGETERAFRALADGHVLVLQTDTIDVAWAPPFSVVPTSFRTITGAYAWHAPCAWDAFGIPAALHADDATIEARCAWSGEPLDCGVAQGRARGDAVIHLVVSAAHFWDDIFFT